MALTSPMDPTPSLEGGNYKPSSAVAAPIVNSVDSIGMSAPAVKKPSATGIGGRHIDWLQMARNAYESSESWLQVNQRAIWARNFAHYRSEHAPDSPVLSDANKHRPRYFWPKTRTLVRDIQASSAAAYFASSDVVAIEAEDSDDQEQVEAATLMKELVNYRLDQTIPWYQLVLGGIQETSVLGSVVSHQSWEYIEKGGKVVKDEPKVRIVPMENVRISPAADWIDPANSSPYFIELMPMYLGDVLSKIAEGENPRSGEPAWRNLGEGQLLSAGNRDNLDTTRRARAGTRRLDPKSNMMETESEFRIIWIHRNIIRHDGEDWLYYTAGANLMLSEPVRLSSVIPWADNKRDYVIGKMEIETDRPYPSGPVELTTGMQKAINELKNQRYENVRQVLNRRYLYRSGSQVDVRALSRNVPGGLIGISAPGPLSNHVEPLNTPDVTASGYQEEDRLSLAMDDLSGSTTGSTVNSNRKLNETATGMNLMAEAGNKIREMELRTFTETWIEPVLRQLVQLEAMYETDETALLIASKKAKLRKVLLSYFNHRFSVSVNVGMGAVSPTQRMQKVQTAVATVVQLLPRAAAAVNEEEITKEIFGAAGFDNGARFFNFEKARQEEQAMKEQGDPAQQVQMQQLQLKAQIAQQDFEISQAKLQLENQKLAMESEKQAAMLQELAAKIDYLVARTDHEKTKLATQNVTSIFQATQAAGTIAQNPGIAPATDTILKSAGFIDYNEAPIVEEITPPLEQPIVEPAIENTHPQFPANPTSPGTGKAGILKGIQTPEIDIRMERDRSQ
jgi:hypothetical protein